MGRIAKILITPRDDGFYLFNDALVMSDCDENIILPERTRARRDDEGYTVIVLFTKSKIDEEFKIPDVLVWVPSWDELRMIMNAVENAEKLNRKFRGEKNGGP
ncbi:MAG: hypothetical protein QXN34_06950 [Archaeoglobaceae archaeon]